MARRSTAVKSVICVTLFVLLFTGYWQRNWLADSLRLYNYQAPATIASLANEDMMTPVAERFFYVNHPAIEDKAPFNTHCADPNEQRVVLGCYLGNRSGIYIYNIADARLAGVEQVTAAHEMLHQAYDRLSSKDRTHIDALLADYYQHHLTNQAVKDKIDGYPDDAAVRVNEMHSIFGTEVRDLTPELETYYQQYFTDRAKVVSYAESYQGEFTKRQQDIAAYDQQLSSLKTQIDSSESDLQSTQTSLGNERQLIARYPKSKDPSGYNALVQSYNLMVDSYNNKIATTKQLISRYNDLVTQRNAIAVQESELQQALNSQLTPATTQ